MSEENLSPEIQGQRYLREQADQDRITQIQATAAAQLPSNALQSFSLDEQFHHLLNYLFVKFRNEGQDRGGFTQEIVNRSRQVEGEIQKSVEEKLRLKKLEDQQIQDQAIAERASYFNGLIRSGKLIVFVEDPRFAIAQQTLGPFSFEIVKNTPFLVIGCREKSSSGKQCTNTYRIHLAMYPNFRDNFELYHSSFIFLERDHQHSFNADIAPGVSIAFSVALHRRFCIAHKDFMVGAPKHPACIDLQPHYMTT